MLTPHPFDTPPPPKNIYDLKSPSQKKIRMGAQIDIYYIQAYHILEFCLWSNTMDEFRGK
jgi:hypothetical protein